MVRSYANTSMAALETEMFLNAHNGFIPLIEWIRYIDDISQYGHMDWNQSSHQLFKPYNQIRLRVLGKIGTLSRHDYLHSLQRQRPTWIWTLHQTDVQNIITTLNITFQPNSCKRGVIYSEAQRYKWIITGDKNLTNQLKKLKPILISRGYNVDKINEAFTNATQHSEHQLLYNQKPANNNTQPIFNIPYNRNTPHIGQIHKRHWYLIEKDQKLNILWPDMPKVAFKWTTKPITSETFPWSRTQDINLKKIQ